MPTHIAKYARAASSAPQATGHLTLMTDLTRDPVFLSARVKPGPAFAQAMLVLGKIVKTSARATAKDHSAYQEWLQGQYLKELTNVQAKRIAGLPALKKRESTIQKEIAPLQKQISEASKEVYDSRSLRKFYDWLYDVNREAWYQLDPVVSVQHDATFFEGFSIDESIYGRVKLPHAALDASGPLSVGTTNIDFGVGLEKEFSRIRSYRPLDLTVGASFVQIQTDIGEAVEKKIDLPNSWVRGLIEVQASLIFAPIKLSISPLFLADVIAEFEKQREKHGPRSLKFIVSPGEPVRIEIEPWGTVLTDHGHKYMGEKAEEVRVWGRRRLGILRDLLADAKSLDVQLIGSGMPSFWTVHIDDIELTVGLSGWTALDWASRARFSSMIPTGSVSDQLVVRAAALLKSKGMLTPAEMADGETIPLNQARSALQKLCLAGKAMFDAEGGAYRWRELFSDFDLKDFPELGLEERKGLELRANKAVTVESDGWEDARRTVVANITDETKQQSAMLGAGRRASSTSAHTTLETDLDGRVLYAECTCSHFRYHKLKQGPCRHMVALAATE